MTAHTTLRRLEHEAEAPAGALALRVPSAAPRRQRSPLATRERTAQAPEQILAGVLRTAVGRLALAICALLAAAALPAVASAAMAPPASSSIATATVLTVGETASGGGQSVDYWQLTLSGGQQVQIGLTPTHGGQYHFELYADSTTETEFEAGSTPPVSKVETSGGAAVTLWAPYTGTFILAVCEASASYIDFYDCPQVVPAVGAPNNNAVTPMADYSFSTGLVPNIPTPTQIASETVPTFSTVPVGSNAGIANLANAPTAHPGDFEAGGGYAVNFWKFALAGGDQMQVGLNESNGGDYHFELYASSTTDADFANGSAVPLSEVESSGGGAVTLWAPYTGTFILAVCEAAASYIDFSYCTKAVPQVGSPSGNAVFPLAPFTFATSVTTPPSPATSQIASETVPSTTINGAQAITLPGFDAGGGSAIDFWQAQLTGGQQIEIGLNQSNGGAYHFELYPASTTDQTFSNATPVSTVESSSSATVTLPVPYTGPFILAVCEASASYSDFKYCTAAAPAVGAPSGNAVIPMAPYSFSTTVVTGDPTATSVGCSPGTFTTGASTTCTATVADTSEQGGSTPTGTVGFGVSPGSGSFGSSTCTLSQGGNNSASCNVTFTPAAVGSYTLTATYNNDDSHQTSSGPATVLVTQGVNATSTTMSCAPPSTVAGTATTCTATVTDTAQVGVLSPTGSVAFSASPDGGSFTGDGSCSLAATGTAGVAACAVAFKTSTAGSYTIEADYDGDDYHYDSSGQGAVTFTKPPPPLPINVVPVVGKATVSGTSASVPLGCQGPHGDKCDLVLSLSVVETLARGKVVALSAAARTTKTLALGSKSVSVATSQSSTVKIALNSTGQALLRKFHNMQVKLEVSRDGASVSAQTLRFATKAKSSKGNTTPG